jgi:hypothetical protein
MEQLVVELERLADSLRIEGPAVLVRPRASRELLVRTWSLRWSLAQGARRRWLALAAQFDFAGYGELCELISLWAVDDECCERVAEAALWELGADALAAPLDAKVWDAYLDAIVIEKPWLTLGAMGAWEELSVAAIELGGRSGGLKLLAAVQDDAGTSRGSELAETLRGAALEPEETEELLEGISVAGVMGLRMMRWALGREEATVGVRAWRAPSWAAGQR